MAGLWSDEQRQRIGAALDEQVPGASDLGALGYVERLLTALDFDPPRIWAAPGAWSGESSDWLEIGPWERHAWAQRIASWRAMYERVAAGEVEKADVHELHRHACEATYGDPAYGGNRDEGGWQRIEFPAPLFPPARANADGRRGASEARGPHAAEEAGPAGARPGKT